jgi:hypothetical protein
VSRPRSSRVPVAGAGAPSALEGSEDGVVTRKSRLTRPGEENMSTTNARRPPPFP